MLQVLVHAFCVHAHAACLCYCCMLNATQHRPRHAARTWTCSIWQWHGHLTKTWTCSMDMNTQPIEMDAQYGLGHAAWTWTCSMDLDMLHIQVHIHAACRVSMSMLHAHVCAACHVHPAYPCPCFMSTSMHVYVNAACSSPCMFFRLYL
jgi:hypothetical protein